MTGHGTALRNELPAAQEWAERLNLSQTGRQSWSGPCPECGGKDRFHVEDRRGKAVVGCRGCMDGQPMQARRQQFGKILRITFAGSSPAVPEAKPAPVDSEADRERQRKIGMAGAIWSATEPADGTPAHVYLANRLAWPPDGTGPDLPEDCRWLARERAPPKDPAIDWYQLPQPSNGALVYAFRTRAGDLKAVSLEALDRDGYLLPRRWRRTFGEKTGATFSAGGSGATLVLVEGEVSALAARWLHPASRIIATGGSPGLKAWRPGPGERGPFLIAADNDGAGRPAAGELADALETAGHACNYMPSMAGDPADDLADTLAERIAIMRFESGMSEADATIAAWRGMIET